MPDPTPPQSRLRRAGQVPRSAARHDSYWPAQLTVLAAILLSVSLPKKLTIGPAWLMPAFEALLLVGLVLATPGSTDTGHHPRRRKFALALVGLVSLVNAISLALLVHYLLKGGQTGGHALVLAGVVLWVTNVLLFSIWFWQLDRGGPLARQFDPEAQVDFLFPQMTSKRLAPPDWRPGFLDYMYVSLTNAAAFSPTDTMPLTLTAKALMTVQSLFAIVTVALVLARAVNILG